MWQDPIVKEVRDIREKYSKAMKNDVEEIFRDISKRQKKSGKKLVSFSPRKPELINKTD